MATHTPFAYPFKKNFFLGKLYIYIYIVFNLINFIVKLKIESQEVLDSFISFSLFFFFCKFFL